MRAPRSPGRYFDSNGDGVLSPQEFTTAVRALASMSAEEGDAPALDLSTEQIERLAAALDKKTSAKQDHERRAWESQFKLLPLYQRLYEDHALEEH